MTTDIWEEIRQADQEKTYLEAEVAIQLEEALAKIATLKNLQTEEME